MKSVLIISLVIKFVSNEEVEVLVKLQIMALLIENMLQLDNVVSVLKTPDAGVKCNHFKVSTPKLTENLNYG